MVELGAHVPHGRLLVGEQVQVLPDELLYLPLELGVLPEERACFQPELSNNLLSLENLIHYLYYMQSDPLLLEPGVLHDAPEVQLLRLHQAPGHLSGNQRKMFT